MGAPLLSNNASTGDYEARRGICDDGKQGLSPFAFANESSNAHAMRKGKGPSLIFLPRGVSMGWAS